MWLLRTLFKLLRTREWWTWTTWIQSTKIHHKRNGWQTLTNYELPWWRNTSSHLQSKRGVKKAQTVFEEHGVIKHDLLAAGWVQSFVNHHFQYGFWKWGFGNHGDVNGNHHFPWFPWPKKRGIYPCYPYFIPCSKENLDFSDLRIFGTTGTKLEMSNWWLQNHPIEITDPGH